MATEIDYMESLTSDANAQAAYVSNATIDNYTKLCSHFDGANNATAYSDPIQGAYTFGGSAKISTTQSKFGGASLYQDGGSGEVSIPDSVDWAFGTGDFTIDWWCRFDSVSNNVGFCDQHVNGSNRHHEYIWIAATKTLYFASVIGATNIYQYRFSFDPSINTWYHIAAVRSGTNFYVFINGVSQTLTVDTAISTNSISDIAAPFMIGKWSNGGAYFNGYIDEFRISKGIARWTANFTPDTAAYPIQSGFILQSFSEPTIKTQGSYALKGIASVYSLNKTLTKTF